MLNEPSEHSRSALRDLIREAEQRPQSALRDLLESIPEKSKPVLHQSALRGFLGINNSSLQR
jgi:hypothetical protein